MAYVKRLCYPPNSYAGKSRQYEGIELGNPGFSGRLQLTALSFFIRGDLLAAFIIRGVGVGGDMFQPFWVLWLQIGDGVTAFAVTQSAYH